MNIEKLYRKSYYVGESLLEAIRKASKDIEETIGRGSGSITFEFSSAEDLKGTIKVWYKDLPTSIEKIFIEWSKELNEDEINNIIEYYRKYSTHPKAYYTKDILRCFPLEEMLRDYDDMFYESRQFEIIREGPFFDDKEKYDYLRARSYPELHKYFNNSLKTLGIEVPKDVKLYIRDLDFSEFKTLYLGGTCIKTKHKPLNREAFPEAFINLIEDGNGSLYVVLSSEYKISKKEEGCIEFKYCPKDFVKKYEEYKISKDIIKYFIEAPPLDEKVDQIARDLGIKHIEIIECKFWIYKGP